MNCKDTNVHLRNAVNQLISDGWAKTNIGKTLLGDNSQGHVNHWLKQDGERVNDFGIKPLTTIADQVKYDVHVVFVPKDTPKEIIDVFDKYNIEFVEKLKTAISKYLSNEISAPKFITRNNKSKIDMVIDDLLGIEKPVDLEESETIDYSDLGEEER